MKYANSFDHSLTITDDRGYIIYVSLDSIEHAEGRMGNNLEMFNFFLDCCVSYIAINPNVFGSNVFIELDFVLYNASHSGEVWFKVGGVKTDRTFYDVTGFRNLVELRGDM